MEKIYCDLMLFATGVIAVLAVVLLNMTVPDKPEYRKLKQARLTLAYSFITLSLLNFTSYLTGYDQRLDRLNTVIVAAYQALLLTGTLLVFIRPDVVTRKWVTRQVYAITGLSVLLYVAMFLIPETYMVFFYCAATLLVIQLIWYSIVFFRSLAKTLEDTDAYYAEDYTLRLSWIKWGFIMMLAIGAMALCTLLTGPWFYVIFIPTYLICYVFVAICMMTYIKKAAFIIPAIGKSDVNEIAAPAHDAVQKDRAESLRKNVQAWVIAKKYRERDVPFSDILDELDTDIVTMRAFMKSEYGMDFRPWRNRLRLQDACEIFREHPEMKPEKVSEIVGYNDSSNFHKDFKRLTGMSASQYRKEAEMQADS